MKQFLSTHTLSSYQQAADEQVHALQTAMIRYMADLKIGMRHIEKAIQVKHGVLSTR